MAINVNEVYQTVLLILNKEQRGYITPDEFNKIGTQVQLEIFEKYFEDMNQQLRVRQDETEYADRVKNIDNKISIFKTQGDCTYDNTQPNDPFFTVPSDLHRIGTVIYKKGSVSVEAERVSRNDLLYQNLSTIVKPTESFPVYAYQGEKDSYSQIPKLFISPDSIVNNVITTYIRKPLNPRWGYIAGGLGQYLYDPNVYVSTGLPVVNNYLFNSITTPFTSFGIVNSVTYTGLTLDTPGITYNGQGTGLVFDMTVSDNSVISSLTVTSPGKGFKIGEEIILDDNDFQVQPQGTDAVITISESSLYSGTAYGSTNFEIDNTDQTELILNILKYCGIVIRDPSIIQTAAQMAMAEDNNEKQ